VQGFLSGLAGSSGWWLYPVLGGLAFGEAALFLGVVLPGEAALLTGGYLAAHGRLSLRLRRFRLGQRVGAGRWDRTEGCLERHGGTSAFLGRPVALLRALVPTMGGAGGMPYRTFLPWNAAGGLVWGGGCVLLGYAFARSLSTVERYRKVSGGLVIGLVVAAVLAGHVVRRRRARHASQ